MFSVKRIPHEAIRDLSRFGVLQAAHVRHHARNVGRIQPLFASARDQALALLPRQNGIEHAPRLLVLQQPLAKAHQTRGMKPGVIHRQTQSLFPTQMKADPLQGLAVRGLLHKRQQRHPRHFPNCCGPKSIGIHDLRFTI